MATVSVKMLLSKKMKKVQVKGRLLISCTISAKLGVHE